MLEIDAKYNLNIKTMNEFINIEETKSEFIKFSFQFFF